MCAVEEKCTRIKLSDRRERENRESRQKKFNQRNSIQFSYWRCLCWERLFSYYYEIWYFLLGILLISSAAQWRRRGMMSDDLMFWMEWIKNIFFHHLRNTSIASSSSHSLFAAHICVTIDKPCVYMRLLFISEKSECDWTDKRASGEMCMFPTHPSIFQKM